MTTEKIDPAEDIPNWKRSLIRIGASFSLIGNGSMASLGKVLGFDPSSYREGVLQAKEVRRTLQYDSSSWDNGNPILYNPNRG